MIDLAHKRSHPRLNLHHGARGGCAPYCLGSLAGCRRPPSRSPLMRKPRSLLTVSSIHMQPPGHPEQANYWGTYACFLTAACLREAGTKTSALPSDLVKCFNMTSGKDVSSPKSEEPAELARGGPEQSGRWHAGGTHLKGALQAWKITLLKIFLLGLPAIF